MIDLRQPDVSSGEGVGIRLVAIETTKIRIPLDRAYCGSHYRMTHRSTILTRVHGSDGTVGEAFVADEDATLDQIEDIIHTELSSAALGSEVLAVERLWHRMWPATFDILRDRRQALVAIASVDTAVWDLVGKILKQPLWRLWGGYAGAVRLIVISGYAGERVDERVAWAREAGLAGMKLKVGGRPLREDIERFRTARRTAGDDFILGADANQAWTLEEAVQFVHGVLDVRLDFLEEPCRWGDDHRALRDVRAIVGARVTAGQSELSASGCRRLMEAAAIDVCNFDASWSGGPSEWRRVAAIAASYGIMMGHHEEPHIASHLVASIPHGVFAECFEPSRDPLWWNAFAERPRIADGVLSLPTAPGLGWVLDFDYLNRYRVGKDRVTVLNAHDGVGEEDSIESRSHTAPR